MSPPVGPAPTEHDFSFEPLDTGSLTILKHTDRPVKDPSELALSALAWLLSDGDRAGRFLALTGLEPDELRAAIGQPATHRAILDFLCAHEPDLIAAADTLAISPKDLAAARDRLPE